PLPISSAAFASATVVAVANHDIRPDFNSAINGGGYNPIIDETAAGAIRSNAWHCSAKFGRAISPASSGTGGPQRDKNSRTRASCERSRSGDGSGIQRLI